MGIFDSALLKEINFTSLPKRSTVIGAVNPAVGGGSTFF